MLKVIQLFEWKSPFPNFPHHFGKWKKMMENLKQATRNDGKRRVMTRTPFYLPSKKKKPKLYHANVRRYFRAFPAFGPHLSLIPPTQTPRVFKWGGHFLRTNLPTPGCSKMCAAEALIKSDSLLKLFSISWQTTGKHWGNSSIRSGGVQNVIDGNHFRTDGWMRHSNLKRACWHDWKIKIKALFDGMRFCYLWCI